MWLCYYIINEDNKKSIVRKAKHENKFDRKNKDNKINKKINEHI